MAQTLAQARLLSTDVLQRGVIETFARTSPVLELLPFMTIAGNSYQYNIEETLPDVEYRDVNQGYTESAGTVIQKQESLVRLGGDVDVDKFIVQTLGNINDQRAIQTNMKVKRLSNQFTKDFFKGNKTTNPLAFDGLDVRLAENNQTIEAGGALTISKLRELLDLVEGGADVLFMSKAMQRELFAIATQGNHNYIYEGKDEFGRHISTFGDVPIRVVEDSVLGFNEAGDTASIYAVKFGAQENVAGLTNGGVMVQDIGELETKPVYRTRIEFYVGLAVFHPKSASRLSGIQRADAVVGEPEVP